MPFPPLALVWIELAVVIGIILHRTILGRQLYATGANLRAANLALVKTRWVWIGAFAASAALSSVTGVVIAGFAGAGTLTIGQPLPWLSVTAALLGGTFIGGPGDYWRTVLGSLLLIVLTTILIALGFSSDDQQILFGVVISLMFALYGREERLQDRV